MSQFKQKEEAVAFKFKVVDDLKQLAELWPRTDRCGSSSHCYAFQCADILEVWCDTIGRARRTKTMFVGVFDDIGRPILLLPLGIERRCGFRVLSFLDGGVSDYNAPIVFDPVQTWERQTLDRFWSGLIAVLPTFDVAIFDKMPADICGVPNPIIGLASAPYDPSGHLVNITRSWEEYAATRLPYKRESSAQRRRLAKLGQVVFTVAQTPVDRQRVLEAMMRQKSQRYIETLGVDGFDRPGYRQYCISMVERFTWPGPLVISALEVDGKILSTNWGLIRNGRFIGIVMSFESGDEWKRFSPGRLLLEDLLKWNFTNGTSIFDFGIGDESYKVAYTDETLPLYEANIAVTAIGRVYQIGKTRTWRRLKAAILRTTKRSGALQRAIRKATTRW
jgi:CelD/BcsL family acetyltransferase involved in cellulose biosynthesis